MFINIPCNRVVNVQMALWCFLALIIAPAPSPSSAFFVFCSDHRGKIKEEHPGITIGDIAKKLGELWGTQTPKDKIPFEARAAKLKEKYEKVTTQCPVFFIFIH